jgi:hypothetical protein
MTMGAVLSENGSYPQKSDKSVHKNVPPCEKGGLIVGK